MFIINDEETDATPDQYSFTPQAVIPAGSLTGSTILNFDYDVLDFGDSRDLVLDLVLSEDQTANLKRPSFTLTFVKECTLNNVVLSITTDTYPDETSYELYDIGVSTTEPISTGGPYDDQASTTIDVVFCLGAGSYGIVVIDSYGDGIDGGGYTVTSNGITLASGVVGASANPGTLPSFGSSTFDLQ